MTHSPDPLRIRQLLADAKVMLLFSPGLCEPRSPLEVLERVLEWVDIVQIRPKPLGAAATRAPCAARDVHDWCLRVLELIQVRPTLELVVMVDDRVDVAAALWSRGCAGVHVGQGDSPVPLARAILGPHPLIGLSTHDARQVAEAGQLEVDYIGFGPIHATETKDYRRGLGAEAAWIANAASARPVFPIGGIDATNAGELERIGRAALGSAILRADDPANAARDLRRLLVREPG